MTNESFFRFNESLRDGLGGQPADTAPSGSLPDPELPAGQGSLTVQVTLARAAIPIEGARVTVTLPQGGDPLAQAVTDRSGSTPRLTLPAPVAALSQAPGTTRPYGVYNIRVEYPGYYTETAQNVPIFDRVSSLQAIALRPLAEGVGQGDILYSDESPSGDL